MTGIVKTAYPNYLFITGDDGRDYFAHISSLVPGEEYGKLLPGVAVEFDPVVPTPLRGARAALVRRQQAA
jgi:cold shock CspA family protein